MNKAHCCILCWQLLKFLSEVNFESDKLPALPPSSDKSYYNTSKFEISLAQSCIKFHSVHKDSIKTVVNGDGSQYKADIRLVMVYAITSLEVWYGTV